jgi:hypothetical protein
MPAMRLHRLLFAIVLLLSASAQLCAGPVNGGTVYLTSIDASNGHFAKYDVATNTWTRLADYFTNAQMAVSAAGELYARNTQTGMIQRYNPITDTWANVLNGPTGVGNSQGNLEITADGRFFYTALDGNSLRFTDASGNWQTANLSIIHNAMGDYDPTSNQYVIGERNSDNARLVDVNTLAVTAFLNGPPGNGEIARFSSIVNDKYYFQYGSLPVHTYDLTNNLAAAQSTGFVPPSAFYNASAAARNSNGLFVASLNGSVFDYFDLDSNSLVNLANYVSIGNHSSLAYVSGASSSVVPEPNTLVLLGFGIASIAGAGFRQRRRNAKSAFCGSRLTTPNKPTTR